MELLKNTYKMLRKPLLLAMLLGSTQVMAQDNAASFWTGETVMYTLLGLVFVTALLVLVVAIYVVQLLKTFLLKNMSEKQRETYEARPGYFERLWTKWNDFKPMEQEAEIILDHDYDGIKELDNHLPPWWKGLFYVTIAYGVVYLLVFHVFQTRPLQEEQYELEMAAAEALKKDMAPTVDFDETTVTRSEEPADLLAGKKNFERFCATCHKADGGGVAGPNLTDRYWKHGGGIKNIYATVKNGVANTAMIPWGNNLNPEQIRQIASYVMSLEGTNPPDAKGPEGDLWVPEEAPVEEPVSGDSTLTTQITPQ